ncbi:hypothetical protein [Zobellia galactanivorans]|uniref:Uncharacterized protein n=1 Tax=Zobellia galactanivorans (strain DSM 12802 / CCUG 47099 / CIP 106680 / NCIMB 13871 / Dsij) TaxID=63186 RepID=G0L490_ZOBGA|nr:hypothetical protein [Zobellia galactanivorans]CAZ98732.1 Conserved hypothetical protein [Zobellia galactanivorans]
MSKQVFRNYDKKAIRQLLVEIGKERYEEAIKDEGLEEIRPLGLEGFYVEWDNRSLNLYYRYPGGTVRHVMNVLGYWAIPKYGWELTRF